MRFRLETIIDKSRQDVWRAFDDPDNLREWQPTLKSFEHQSGERGRPGAVSRLTYDEGGREIVLVETIMRRNEPDEFTGTYDAPSVFNTIRNQFIELDEGRTRWVVDAEFTFNNFLFRLIAPFMKGSLVKRTVEDMQRFKELVERS